MPQPLSVYCAGLNFQPVTLHHSVARAAAVAIVVRTLADLVKVADSPELKEFFAALQMVS